MKNLLIIVFIVLLSVNIVFCDDCLAKDNKKNQPVIKDVSRLKTLKSNKNWQTVKTFWKELGHFKEIGLNKRDIQKEMTVLNKKMPDVFYNIVMLKKERYISLEEEQFIYYMILQRLSSIEMRNDIVTCRCPPILPQVQQDLEVQYNILQESLKNYLATRTNSSNLDCDKSIKAKERINIDLNLLNEYDLNLHYKKNYLDLIMFLNR